MNTTRSTDNDVHTVLKNLHVVADDSSPNTSMTFNIHEISNSNNDFLNLLSELTSRGQDQSLALLDRQIDLLENRNRESCSFSGPRLSLGDNITVYWIFGILIMEEATRKKRRVKHTIDDRKDGTLLDGRRTLKTRNVLVEHLALMVELILYPYA